MPLLTFKEYQKEKNESSPATRNKWAVFLGLQPPMSADVFGHATPPPVIAADLLKKINEKKPKKNVIKEGKKKTPDRSFDHFIKKAEEVSKEAEEDIEKADKEEEKLDKEIKKKKPELKKKPEKVEKKPVKDEEDEVMASLKKDSKNSKEPAKKDSSRKSKETDEISVEESSDWEKLAF